jgi:hypothetical protein
VPVDLAALGDDATAFFSRLVDLDGGSADFVWSEYVWLAAGVFLVGGGVYAARIRSRPSIAHEPRSRETLEEAQ